MEILNVASSQIDSSISLTQPQNSARTNFVAKTELNSGNEGDLNKKDTLSNEEINKVTERLNEQMESLQTNIRFAYNDKISSLYVNVMEKDTGRVIRKVPTENMMKLSEHFKEIIGLLVDKEG